MSQYAFFETFWPHGEPQSTMLKWRSGPSLHKKDAVLISRQTLFSCAIHCLVLAKLAQTTNAILHFENEPRRNTENTRAWKAINKTWNRYWCLQAICSPILKHLNRFSIRATKSAAMLRTKHVKFWDHRLTKPAPSMDPIFVESLFKGSIFLEVTNISDQSSEWHFIINVVTLCSVPVFLHGLKRLNALLNLTREFDFSILSIRPQNRSSLLMKIGLSLSIISNPKTNNS